MVFQWISFKEGLHIYENVTIVKVIKVDCIIQFLPCATIAGVDKFMDNIEDMLGKRPHVWWKIVWKYITPGILVVSIICLCVFFNPLLVRTGLPTLEKRNLGQNACCFAPTLRA